MLYSFFSATPRRLDFYVLTFRNTVYSIFIGRVNKTYGDGIDSVPKRRHIKFRHRGVTQKKEYNELFVVIAQQDLRCA